MTNANVISATEHKQRKQLSGRIHEARQAAHITIREACELVHKHMGRSKNWYESREYGRGPVKAGEVESILKIFADAAKEKSTKPLEIVVAEAAQRIEAAPAVERDYLLDEARMSLCQWIQTTKSRNAINEVARIKQQDER